MITLGLESEEKASHAPNWHATPPSPHFTHVLWYLSPPPTPTPPKERQRRIFGGGRATRPRNGLKEQKIGAKYQEARRVYVWRLSTIPAAEPRLTPFPTPRFQVRSVRAAAPCFPRPTPHPPPRTQSPTQNPLTTSPQVRALGR